MSVRVSFATWRLPNVPGHQNRNVGLLRKPKCFWEDSQLWTRKREMSHERARGSALPRETQGAAHTVLAGAHAPRGTRILPSVPGETASPWSRARLSWSVFPSNDASDVPSYVIRSSYGMVAPHTPGEQVARWAGHGVRAEHAQWDGTVRASPGEGSAWPHGATAEPLTMAKPTSAFFRAGPSFVPSPVTATTCRWSPTVLSMMPEGQTHLGQSGPFCSSHLVPATTPSPPPVLVSLCWGSTPPPRAHGERSGLKVCAHQTPSDALRKPSRGGKSNA